jgi:hypothetical protein
MNSARTLHLRSPDGIVVHLTSDIHDEHRLLMSRAGQVDHPELYGGGPLPWRHTIAHPRFDGVHCSLLIDADTGELFLLDAWHRAALFSHTQHEALLQDHAERHRAWIGLLAQEHEALSNEALDSDAHDDECPAAAALPALLIAARV